MKNYIIFSRKHLITFILLFALIGSFIIWRSFALNPNLPGDVNGDNIVDITDVSMLLQNYGSSSYPQADFNGSGTIDVGDLSVVLANYGKSLVLKISHNLSNNQTLSGSYKWEVFVDAGVATKVEYYIDGTLKWTEGASPYIYNGDGNTLDTTTLSNSTHALTAKAFDSSGFTTSVSATVNVNNSSTPPPTGLTVNDRWYSPNSPWNKPIPAGTPYRYNNSSLNAGFIKACTSSDPKYDCIAPTLGGVPAFYFANSSTPLVPVTVNYPSCNSRTDYVPIPAGAQSPFQLSSSDREARIGIMMTDSSVEWNLYKASAPGQIPLTESGVQCPATSNWSAIIVKKSTSGWQGSGIETSSRAAGFLDGSGLIRPRDTKMTTESPWDHALALTYSHELAGYVPPAKDHDGECTDVNQCVPAGARLQLDPSYNCSNTTLMPFLYQRQMCRTLQVYGMIVTDKPCHWPCTGGGLYSENPRTTQLNLSFVDGGGNYNFPYNSGSTYQALPRDLYPYIKFIDWEKWTGL